MDYGETVLERGKTRGWTLGQIGDDANYEATRWAEQSHSLGRVCPLCGEEITNRARACRRDALEWGMLRRSPRALAEWIAFEAKPRREELGTAAVWVRNAQEAE
jgi:hypothetical protein